MITMYMGTIVTIPILYDNDYHGMATDEKIFRPKSPS